MSLDVHLEKCVLSKVFSSNITHNLAGMAIQAGVYYYLWRPDELSYINKARDLILPLTDGLNRLVKDADAYKKFDPENGWGCYDNLVKFIKDYIEACRQNPEAIIRVSR